MLSASSNSSRLSSTKRPIISGVMVRSISSRLADGVYAPGGSTGVFFSNTCEIVFCKSPTMTAASSSCPLSLNCLSTVSRMLRIKSLVRISRSTCSGFTVAFRLRNISRRVSASCVTLVIVCRSRKDAEPFKEWKRRKMAFRISSSTSPAASAFSSISIIFGSTSSKSSRLSMINNLTISNFSSKSPSNIAFTFLFSFLTILLNHRQT